MIEHAQFLAAPPCRVTALHASHADDVRHHFHILAHIDRGLDEADIATGAGDILFEIDDNATGGAAVVVERVVRDVITNQRRQDRALSQFAADGERSFAIRITVGLRASRGPNGQD